MLPIYHDMLMTLPQNKVIEGIHKVLNKKFTPSLLIIKDKTHKHTQHSQYIPGKLHIDITIQSKYFINLNRIQQHKLIYQALEDYKDQLHAIAIKSSDTSE